MCTHIRSLGIHTKHFFRWDCCCCRFVDFSNCTQFLCTHHILFFYLFGHFNLYARIRTYHIDITLHILFSVFHSAQRVYKMRLTIPNRLTLYLFLFCFYFNFHFAFAFRDGEKRLDAPEKRQPKRNRSLENWFSTVTFSIASNSAPTFLSAFFPLVCLLGVRYGGFIFHIAFVRVCVCVLACLPERMGERASEPESGETIIIVVRCAGGTFRSRICMK